MFSAPRRSKRSPYPKGRFLFLRRFLPRSLLSFLPPLAHDKDSDHGSPPSGFDSLLGAAGVKFVGGGDDVEAQNPSGAGQGGSPSVAAEYSVETGTKLAHLALWFSLNLVLTLYNKALLQGFAFPWLLTTIHTSFVAVGCYSLLLQGYFKLTTLAPRQHAVLVAFSFLFTVNIAMSNVSLAAVSVPFHQIMRSTTPVITLIIYRVFYSRSYSTSTYLAITPIVFGVGLATYGDYYFSLTGLFLTLTGVILAALKTVVTNKLMTGELALPALELLLRMSPLAALQSLIYSLATGEATELLAYMNEGRLPWTMCIFLVGNGAIAFVLNISSLQTNKLAGALTMTVAGNLKQCLTILLGVMLFNVKVGVLNGLGMLITLVGAAWYRKVELDSKGRPPRLSNRL